MAPGSGTTRLKIHCYGHATPFSSEAGSVELSDTEPTSRGQPYDIGIGTEPFSAELTPSESALVSGSFDHDLNSATTNQQRFGPGALTEVHDADGNLVSIYAYSESIDLLMAVAVGKIRYRYGEIIHRIR